MKRRFLPLGCSLSGIIFCLTSIQGLGASESVIISEKVVGRTPSIIGINTGEMPRESAFPEWVRALGVNGARLRLGVKPGELKGPSIASEVDMTLLMKKLRDNAEAETPKLWKHPESTAGESLDALRHDEIELLATITCPFSFKLLGPEGQTDWSAAWKFWSAYYAQAYQLARGHDVCRFQLFNEPDHAASMKLSQAEYSVRLRIGSDAIQAALEDVSKVTGKKLDPLISAPCTASIKAFESRGKRDTRDPQIGWGRLSMRDRHIRLDGKTDPAYSQFQQYAYQQYSVRPANFLTQLTELRNQVTEANGGSPFPIIMSEYNVHTAKDFSKLPTTLDSPKEFSALGSMATVIAGSGLDEVYFFRLTLSVNPENNQVKKNGIHHVNESGPIPEITGTTRAAEVIRLSASALTGSRALLATRATDEIGSAATLKKGVLQVLLARTNSVAQSAVELKLPPMKGGHLLTYQSVTEETFGTTAILQAEADGGSVTVPLPSESVGLLSARPVASTLPHVFGTIGSCSTSEGKLVTGGKERSLTLLSFPPIDGSKKEAIFLRLKSRSRNPNPVPIHLYLTKKAFLPGERQAGLPPFSRKAPPSEGQSGLTVEGLGRGLDLVGGFTVNPDESDTLVEVTRSLNRMGAENQCSFILSRDFRQQGEKIEDQPLEWLSAEIIVFDRRALAESLQKKQSSIPL